MDSPKGSSLWVPTALVTAAQWYQRGQEQAAGDYPAEAAESYRQALLAGGPDARVCYDLAHALAEIGQMDAAAERYRQAVEIKPDFSDAWNNLGAALAELGRGQDAADAFQRVLELCPDDLRSIYNLADTLDELGRTQEAAPHWQAYLRQDSTSRWAAHARRQLGQSRPRGAG
jgi:tetratricopeptide (TPR) repeat protein